MILDPEVIAVAAPLLAEFVKWAAPLLTNNVDLRSLAAQFWGEKNLGPMPPDLQAWDDLDASIDKDRADKKAGVK
jgi:hypothetical protein